MILHVTKTLFEPAEAESTMSQAHLGGPSGICVKVLYAKVLALSRYGQLCDMDLDFETILTCVLLRLDAAVVLRIIHRCRFFPTSFTTAGRP